jgi:hypothetical protein
VATSATVQGQIVDVANGSPSSGLSVLMGAYREATTDADGQFAVEGARPGTYTTTVRGAAIVERTLTLHTAADRMRISVIPSSFDLVAFDQMFRSENARLQRWTSRPVLVVVASTMTLTSTSSDSYQASAEQMSGDEVSQMVAQLTEALTLHSGGTFGSFAGVEIERPAAGERVSVTRNGKIVVGRYSGILDVANTVGYGRWSTAGDGTVVGGAMFLDRDFDRNDSRRRLLRMHELGHALGYQHVTSRTSIMNPSIGAEPTEFDRSAAVIAFARPPGNRSPDTDPANGPRLTLGTGSAARWSDPTPCR